MIKTNLKESATCFELREYAKILESNYTCYDSSTTKIMLERGMDNYIIEGFVVSITSEAKAKSYTLKNSTDSKGEVKMYSGSTIIRIPESGEAETYIFNIGNGTKAELGVLSGGRVCEQESYEIPKC